MMYSKLNDSWQTQRENYKIWKMTLVRKSDELREKLEEILQLPNKEWTDVDTDIKYRYIDFVDITKNDRPRVESLSKISTIEEKLVFGIGITLEYGIDAYPKQFFYLPIAISFVKKEPVFSLYDIETLTSSGNEKDIEKFGNTIISVLLESLNTNPLDGSSKQPQMGFIKSP